MRKSIVLFIAGACLLLLTNAKSTHASLSFLDDKLTLSGFLKMRLLMALGMTEVLRRSKILSNLKPSMSSMITSVVFPFLENFTIPLLMPTRNLKKTVTSSAGPGEPTGSGNCTSTTIRRT